MAKAPGKIMVRSQARPLVQYPDSRKASSGTLWYPVVPCGTSGYFVALRDTLWHFGTLRYCVILCGTTWYGTLWYYVGELSGWVSSRYFGAKVAIVG